LAGGSLGVAALFAGGWEVAAEEIAAEEIAAEEIAAEGKVAEDADVWEAGGVDVEAAEACEDGALK
jgi:hypothetical protein